MNPSFHLFASASSLRADSNIADRPPSQIALPFPNEAVDSSRQAQTDRNLLNDGVINLQGDQIRLRSNEEDLMHTLQTERTEEVTDRTASG